MAMQCDRCGGLLVRERLFEADGMSSTEQIDCERCVNCGALEDSIFRANRQPTRPQVRSREPRGPRIQPVASTAFMRGSTASNHPEVRHDLTFDRHYVPPARSDIQRIDQAHDQYMRCNGSEPMEQWGT